jgi:AcrR family transcriptional regulator
MPRTRDAERAKADILEAARRLFGERDFAAVSIRDVAEAAGVSHGLVQHHFGTREELVGAVVRDEINRFVALPRAPLAALEEGDFTALRRQLKDGLGRFADYARLIARAELAGAQPEKLLDPAVPTPSKLLADAIRDLQARTGAGEEAPDPALVSAFVNAGLFAFAAMTPWLMTSAGLEPRDYEARFDEIIDIAVRLIAVSTGLET